jgi:putative intracellular protease/amidase
MANAATPRSLATSDFNLLEDTMSVADVNIADHDAIYLPGGHAVMFDLPQSERLASLITEFYESDKIVWPLCHGPAGLLNVRLSNGDYLVTDKDVTGLLLVRRGARSARRGRPVQPAGQPEGARWESTPSPTSRR